MRLLRTLTLIGLIYLFAIFISCCDETLEIVYNNIDLFLLDNSGKYPIITNSDSINHAFFGIRLRLLGDIKYSTLKTNSINPINSCYATSCLQTYIKKDNITGLNIYISSPLDNSLTNPINEYFVARYSSDTLAMPVSIEQIVEKINSKSFDWKYEGSEDIDLLLIRQIEIQQSASYIIQMRIDNGTEFLDSTSYVKLY